MIEFDFDGVLDSIELLDKSNDEKIEKNHELVEMLNKKGIKIKKPSSGFIAS